MVELRDITVENLDEVLKLKVAKEQESFVSTTAYSLAQAWVCRETAYPFAIYADGVAVGFIMLGYYEERDQYTLWKFLIDEKHQNKGYGRQALQLGIRYLLNRFHPGAVYTGVAFENSVAKRLYESFGFRETGERDETMLELKLTIDSSLS